MRVLQQVSKLAYGASSKPCMLRFETGCTSMHLGIKDLINAPGLSGWEYPPSCADCFRPAGNALGETWRHTLSEVAVAIIVPCYLGGATKRETAQTSYVQRWPSGSAGNRFGTIGASSRQHSMTSWLCGQTSVHSLAIVHQQGCLKLVLLQHWRGCK